MGEDKKGLTRDGAKGRSAPTFASDDVESKPRGTVTTCCLTCLLTSGSELSSPAVRPDPASDERFKAAGLASRLRGVGGSLEAIVHAVSR